MSTVCIDANLALKLVLDEPDSKLAHSLWTHWARQQTTIIAPPLWLYEVTSVIRNQVHWRKLAPALEEENIRFLHSLPVDLLVPNQLHFRAWQLARHFQRPAAYDAHYLALAEIAHCPLWTADQRLYNAVRHELAWVEWLSNFQQGDQNEA